MWVRRRIALVGTEMSGLSLMPRAVRNPRRVWLLPEVITLGHVANLHTNRPVLSIMPEAHALSNYHLPACAVVPDAVQVSDQTNRREPLDLPA